MLFLIIYKQNNIHRMMTQNSRGNIDCLDGTHEPSDLELATVMGDVARVVKEKRNIAFVRLHEGVNDEVRRARARIDSLRTQFKVPRL